MNLPNQCAPVQRNIATASMSQETGVEASFAWGNLLTTLGGAIAPVALDLLQQL